MTGRKIKRNKGNEKEVIIDNRNVIPYNLYLLKKYNCHINFEVVDSICNSIKAIKYINKYQMKGLDRSNGTR